MLLGCTIPLLYTNDGAHEGKCKQRRFSHPGDGYRGSAPPPPPAGGKPKKIIISGKHGLSYHN